MQTLDFCITPAEKGDYSFWRGSLSARCNPSRSTQLAAALLAVLFSRLAVSGPALAGSGTVESLEMTALLGCFRHLYL